MSRDAASKISFGICVLEKTLGMFQKKSASLYLWRNHLKKNAICCPFKKRKKKYRKYIWVGAAVLSALDTVFKKKRVI